MSRVTLMEKCPSISERTLGLTSFESSSVAQVWRRSWKRIGGRRDFVGSGLKERLRKLEGLMTVPVSVAKMSLPGWERESIRSISSSWRERCARRAITAFVVSLMVQRLLFVRQ
jgi:hypothetical protein